MSALPRRVRLFICLACLMSACISNTPNPTATPTAGAGPTATLPPGATPIPVMSREKLAGGLKDFVERLPARPVLVDLVEELGYGNPTLLLVLPSPDGVPQLAMMTRFRENPWKRYPWLILTPVTAAGDAVTFPLQLMLMPEC